MIVHNGHSIGQIVPKSSAILSNAQNSAALYKIVMSIMTDEAAFNEALCARVHSLRNERGWTSAQMATALGVPPDRYRKYEYRSPLPSYLFERFALIVGCDIDFLITGKANQHRKLAEIQEKRRA